MSTTYEEAVDEIFTLINTAWLANTAAIVGYVPEMRWPGVEEPDKPDYSKHFARSSQQTVTEEQSTLKDGEGSQRYTASGLVFIQIFCPKSEGKTMANGRKLAIVGRDSLRGKKTTGGVWFRKVRIRELEPETKWYRFNVIAEYEYDECS